jgi:hypothetical protein
VNHNALLPLIEIELQRSPATEVIRLSAQLAERASGHVVAVMFYGSSLRTGSVDGILDYYILLDDVRAWPASRLATLGNRLLPPNVGYVEAVIEGRTLRAKYAVMSLSRFSGGMSTDALDTTLWARFSQPCACVFARSTADHAAVADAICRATVTAACWAAWLGPESGDALDYWRTLYARTYDAELRVEPASRGAELIDSEAGRYARLLPLGWTASGIAFDTTAGGKLHPRLARSDRSRAARRWALRRWFGKLLNVLRLFKSAFTFEGAMDYVVWKVERHSGVRLEVRPWQRRHPLLAAPALYWRLRRLGVLR